MSVDTLHPKYEQFAERWKVISHWLDEQDVIHAQGTKYLPMTPGMLRSKNKDEQYQTYLKRARASGITRAALSGIMGLVFDAEPVTNDPITPVTNTGLNVVNLARDVMRSNTSYGRAVLVVDAPVMGGQPYITLYRPESLINWKTDSNNEYLLSMAVFKECVQKDGEFTHDTKDQYRVYRKTSEDGVTVQVYDDSKTPVAEPVKLPVQNIPVIVIGSINTSPDCDPVPLYPVAMCAIAAYQVSADLRQDLYLSGQRQLWMGGCSEEQFKSNISSGYGAGSAWYLGEEGGQAGFIESTGTNYADMTAEREYELKQAEQYAVRITQSNNSNESGKALEIRASSQHASIYTLAKSASIGISRALSYLKEWNGSFPVDEIELQTDFAASFASEQMVVALNTAIDSQNAPRSAMFELLRQAGLSTKDNEEIESEINEQAVIGLPVVGV